MATAEELDKGIADLLAQKVQGDYLLASTLFAFHVNQGYRLMGYRSVAEYLRERFRGEEQDHAARMHARGFQRLIREFKLAQEIPAFKAAFDSISRSNRRLIAQVITKDNAEIWIAHAKTLNYRELEEKIVTLPSEKKNDGVVTKKLRMYADQLELLNRAFAIARELVEEEGKDPRGPEGPLVEMIVQEFLSTYATDESIPFMSYLQCPGCGHFTAMLRRTEQDVVVEDGTVMVYECRKCAAGVAVKAFGGG